MIVRDLRLDQVQATLALPTDTHATRARISPDLRMLAVAWTANADPKVRFQTRVWEAATGQVIGTLRTAATPVASLAYRPDSGRLAAAAHGNLIIWDMPAAKEVLSVPIEGAPPHVLEYSPDAKLLAGCSTAGPKDVQVTLWDATTCKELRRWKIPAPFGWSLAFCSESKLLAVGTVDNEVRIYSVDAELPVRVLRGPIGLVRFAPGNKRLVNWWLKDRTAKIWDIQTGRELLTLRGHERGIYHGALANDGVFTTADDHGNVRVFDGRPWVNDAAPVSK
jgi:WD40 repeat protein